MSRKTQRGRYKGIGKDKFRESRALDNHMDRVWRGYVNRKQERKARKEMRSE